MRLDNLKVQQEKTIELMNDYEKNNNDAVIDVHKQEFYKHKKAILEDEIQKSSEN